MKNDANNPNFSVEMRLKGRFEAENDNFEGFHQRNFEDILHPTKVRVLTFLNFFQLWRSVSRICAKVNPSKNEMHL